MADNKKSIVVYADWIHQFEPLTDEEAGRLIKHFFNYVNDKNPVSDRMTELLFTPIKHQLKRDLAKWETTLEGRSKAGKASAEARKIAKEQTSTNSTNVDFLQQTSTNSTVTVNDTVTVTVNDILLEKETKEYIPVFNFSDALNSLGANKQLISDWLKVRKTKKLTNTETAFNGFKSELLKSGKNINFVLDKCVVNSWGGFKAEWIKEINTQNIVPMASPIL